MPEKKQQQFATCFCFAENHIFVSYEDGLITAWEVGTKKFLYPMIGHTNRINALERIEKFLFSSANDCTVRQWDITNGVCDNIYKFADPISVTKVNFETKFMFTASWDKMVRVVDLEKKIIMKGFIASKETIKEMIFTNDYLVVAGVDPIIRAYHLETGQTKIF